MFFHKPIKPVEVVPAKHLKVYDPPAIYYCDKCKSENIGVEYFKLVTPRVAISEMAGACEIIAKAKEKANSFKAICKDCGYTVEIKYA